MVYAMKAWGRLTHLEETLIRFSRAALCTQQVRIMLSLLFFAFYAPELLFKDCWEVDALQIVTECG